MTLHPIHAGFFKLDGGAMFGVVPKTLWQKSNPPDENNLCTWALRCLLIDQGERRILVDTGIGNKQGEKFLKHFQPHGEQTLLGSLKEKGYAPEDITDVFLTHLHFDHCGGGVRWKDEEQQEAVLTFPHATYWSTQKHWDWALNPNAREKASFLKENILPIQESGQLKFIDRPDEKPSVEEWMPGIDVLFVDGHTESQMLPVIKDYQGKTIIFGGDLLPSSFHVPMPWVMSFDVRPLNTLEEKERILGKAAENGTVFFLEHDPVNECCTVHHKEGKGLRLEKTLSFHELSGT